MLDEIRADLTACLALPGMNRTLLAHLARVHRNTLEGFEQDGWNPTIQTLERIRKVAGTILELTKS